MREGLPTQVSEAWFEVQGASGCEGEGLGGLVYGLGCGASDQCLVSPSSLSGGMLIVQTRGVDKKCVDPFYAGYDTLYAPLIPGNH